MYLIIAAAMTTGDPPPTLATFLVGDSVKVIPKPWPRDKFKEALIDTLNAFTGILHLHFVSGFTVDAVSKTICHRGIKSEIPRTLYKGLLCTTR